MKRSKKIVQVELDLDEWWPLSRYAASLDKKNPSLRRVVKQQLMPLINELKEKYAKEDPNRSKSRDDVH